MLALSIPNRAYRLSWRRYSVSYAIIVSSVCQTLRRLQFGVKTENRKKIKTKADKRLWGRTTHTFFSTYYNPCAQILCRLAAVKRNAAQVGDGPFVARA